MSFGSVLLPLPRTINVTGGTWKVPDTGFIVLDVPRPADLLFTAQQAKKALADYAGATWEIGASNHLPAALSLTLDAALEHPQGYQLTISEQGIHIAGKDQAGLFYGVMTLNQLLRIHDGVLPLLNNTDWPDFSARGVMLDISRDKVPTMDTLFSLIDLLASWKVNQFQLYIEHTFAYHNHREV